MFSDNLKNRWRLNKSNVKTVSAPALLIICNLFLFGPATIYSGNISEFNISLIDILKYYAVPGMIMLLIFLGIGIAFSRKYLSLYVALIFAVGVLLWLQGNILVWDYGVFGKGDIDWTKNSWRGWADGALWVVLLALAWVFHKQVSRITTLVCTVLLSLQFVMLIYTSVQKPELWEKKANFPVAPPKEIFEFSSKQNIIHVILDEFQSTVFQEIIDEDPDYYYAALEGFTFFKETTGSFPTTLMSIPAILSEKVYKNDIPIQQFIESVFKGKTIINALYDSEFEIDIAAPYYLYGRYTHFYCISVPYGVTEKEYALVNSNLMLDLVLFRHLPHFLKKAVHNSRAYLPVINLRKHDIAHIDGARHFAHKDFLQDFTDTSSINRAQPVYKFIHLTTTHYPAVLNKNCQYAGDILPWRWENIKVQAKCSFDSFLRFLTKLKSLGVYDKALIILQADHGYWEIPESANQIKLKNSDRQIDGDFGYDKEYFAKVVCSSLPLLAIKLPGVNGPLRISKAPTQLTDIPATISSILDLNEEFNGRSVFEVDDNELRERKYYYYEQLNRQGDDFFRRLDEYVIAGSVFDKSSWRLGLTYHLPESSFQAKKIDFGTKEASRFLRLGWCGNESNSKEGTTYNWALGNSASIFLSLPKDEVVVLTANVKTLKFVKPQRVTIKVDGKKIGMWEIGSAWKWEKHSIVIEPDEHRPDVSVVDFVFSEYYEPDERVKRPLAVLFESITLNKPGFKR